MTERQTMIEGVTRHALRRSEDERGAVLTMLRCDEAHFGAFGEIYFSRVNPGFVKGWIRHEHQTSRLAVIDGLARFVLYDDRVSSPSRGVTLDLQLGESCYELLIVPPGIWTSFASATTSAALIANCADQPHDASEVQRRAIGDELLPKVWAV